MNFLETLFTGNSPLAKLLGIGLQTYAGEVQEFEGQKRYVAPYSVQAQCLLSRYKGLALSEDGGPLSSYTHQSLEMTKSWCATHTDILLDVMSRALLDQHAEKSRLSDERDLFKENSNKYKDALVAAHERICGLKTDLKINSEANADYIGKLNTSIARLKADQSESAEAISDHSQHIDELSRYVDKLENKLLSDRERHSRESSSDSLIKDVALGGLSGYALGRLIHSV